MRVFFLPFHDLWIGMRKILQVLLAVLLSGGGCQPKEEFLPSFSAYVEAPWDTDADGWNDLVLVRVHLPEAARREEVPVVLVVDPYGMGTTASFFSPSVSFTEDPALSYASIYRPGRAHDCLSQTEQSALEAVEPVSGRGERELLKCLEKEGFAVVMCAGPGTAGSQGWQTGGGRAELDAYEAVAAWLSKEVPAFTPEGQVDASWSSGRLGALGHSYGGALAYGLAMRGTPGLETVVVSAGLADWYDFVRVHPKTSLSMLAMYCASRSFTFSDREIYGSWLCAVEQEEQHLYPKTEFWRERTYAGQGMPAGSALILHALEDPVVPVSQSLRMAETYRKGSKHFRLVLYHGDHSFPQGPAETALICAWLVRELKREK
jgi:X-Pro dipeptidyl-peptidase